jgi:3-hydroxyisobutyrate dehydrogenase
MKFEKVGFIGIGAMGSGMARNLLKKGYKVIAYDIDKNRVRAIEGIVVAEDVREVAKSCNIVFTSLPTVSAVEAVILGEDGLLSNNVDISYILDMSTIDPGTTRKLADKAAEIGVKFLDCPVSGGPTGAANGTLTTMVGAEDDDFENIKPVLSCLASNIIHVGGVGSGQTVKLVNNVLAAIHTVALAEALLTGTQAGVKLDVLAEVISKSSGRSFIIDYFAPNSILKGNYDNPLFMLKLMHKDVSLYMKMAEEYKIPSILSSITKELYSAALFKGWDTKDHTAVCKIVEDLAGVNIVKA